MNASGGDGMMMMVMMMRWPSEREAQGTGNEGRYHNTLPLPHAK